MNDANGASPTELARVALRRIAEARLPPTPENYARMYFETAGMPVSRELAAATSGQAAVPPELVEQLNGVVARMVATSGDLADGIDEKSARMSASLDELVADESGSGAIQLLQVIVATARDMRGTLRDSHAELLHTRKALAEIQSELVESRKLLGQDPLTGTENRRAMDAIMVREIERARADSEPLSVAMIDLDHFKVINDTHGHAIGDAALVHLTRLAKSMLRGHDAFIRYGGEEFVLVMPETALQGAAYVTGRLQALLRKTPLKQGGLVVPISFSAGVATLTKDDSEGSLLARADAALYDAKLAGRDRVVARES